MVSPVVAFVPSTVDCTASVADTVAEIVAAGTLAVAESVATQYYYRCVPVAVDYVVTGRRAIVAYQSATL